MIGGEEGTVMVAEGEKLGEAEASNRKGGDADKVMGENARTCRNREEIMQTQTTREAT